MNLLFLLKKKTEKATRSHILVPVMVHYIHLTLSSLVEFECVRGEIFFRNDML